MHQAKLIYRKRFSFALSGLDIFLFLFFKGLHPLLYPYGLREKTLLMNPIALFQCGTDNNRLRKMKISIH